MGSTKTLEKLSLVMSIMASVNSIVPLTNVLTNPSNSNDLPGLTKKKKKKKKSGNVPKNIPKNIYNLKKRN